ncbi:hypothetical protein Micbo1qcDRAFT_230148 [Microdochium bolleyi]|uniref:RING-type domain-containing protein n=1 Tax=Microdochium bolleyi TaxID=196109 RepID=A0A136JK50_9PEZI|nr:hypothetical protein Micbo1qcDRAFT_230148 [Microdochium bolleyi]
MAALTEAQVEMANSLTQDELPTKLRCAVCSKLAINAFRLPCCETAICETCQSTLPTSCPVCEHSPVSGDDCTVYKSLRTTIRVFLKTEEKKREASRPKLSDSAPQTPVEASTPTTAIQATSENVPNTTADEASARQPFEPSEELVPTKDVQLDEHSQVVAAGDAQEQAPEHDEHANQIEEEGSCKKQNSAQPAERTSENGGIATGGDVDESFGAGDSTDDNQQSGTNYGPDNAGGNFNGIGYAGGDMNQMQMMMAMQNGMNPAAFGSFPMSGLDMNMNPMMMQNMFMNGGFGAQGMGMNGMNMNMGMNGFNGGGNDWNGQQSWNVGQDNFNPNAPGMGNGDFGNLNTGNYAGYGHHNQYNDYNRGGFGFRGRGRGRGRGFYGGYGRGYYNGYNNPQQNWAHQNPQYHNQGAQAVGSDGGQNAITGPENNDNQITDQTGTATQANGDGKAKSADGPDSSHQQLSGPGRPDGMQSDASSVTVPDVPLNAPTGPKAMRQGLPNTSFHYLKARGLLPGENATGAAVGVSPIEDQTRSRSRSVHTYKNEDARHSDNDDRAHGSSDQGRSRRHDGQYDEPKSHPASRTPSRSRSRERKDSRRHRRHRSGSVSDTGDRDDGHHGPDEHRHRSHKSSRRSTKNEDDPKARSRDEPYDDKPRSVSPNDRDLGRDRDDHRERDKDRDHKRSSHRSRRDRDDRRRDRERDRDRDRERDKDRTRDADDDRHRRSSHRSSRRDRDYERGDRDKDRDDRRHERRDRDRDRDSRRSSKAATSTPLTPIEAPEFNPPAGPKRHTSIFNIKGGASGSGGDLNHKRSSATGTGSSAQAPSSSSAAKDSHTLEREARDRERLLKEAQRLARGFGGAGSKRGRDDKDDRDGGSRRKSRRSEAVNDDEGESRMRRLEAERERDRYE